MAARTQVGKKHFMKAVHDELAKFEQKEIEFQKTERNRRAARLRLPIGKHYPLLSKSATDGGAGTFRSLNLRSQCTRFHCAMPWRRKAASRFECASRDQVVRRGYRAATGCLRG
jgi:hypothetical protein